MKFLRHLTLKNTTRILISVWILLGISKWQAALNYATSIDISTTTFSGTTFSMTALENIITGVIFNNDGIKMFVVGSIGDDVNEHNLK